MSFPTRTPSDGRTRDEEEPLKEPPRSSAPPTGCKPQMEHSEIDGNVATPEQITTAEVLAAGPHNPTKSHASFRRIEIEVSGCEKVSRAVPPVLSLVERLA